MEILQKKLSEIQFGDVKFLVDSKIKENTYLEYKGQDFLNESKNPTEYDKHRGELIYKIAGLANNRGGLMILGVKEDNKTKEPLKIQSPEIPQFGQVLSSTIMRGLQPVIVVDWRMINNESNPTEFVYVLKILESPVPVMIYYTNYKEGIFPIRVGDETKIAEFHDVELLFGKKRENLRVIRAAIDIFETLYKIYNPNSQFTPPVKENMLNRIMIQYNSLLPELGIIPADRSNPTLHILDRYLLAVNIVHDMQKLGGKEWGESYSVVLTKLKEFWSKKLGIMLKSDDFSDENLRRETFFQ